MKKHMRGRSPPEKLNREEQSGKKDGKMKKKERTGRILLALLMAVWILLFLLPDSPFCINVVLSGSMEPALQTGGLAVTDKSKTKPEIGDIITYHLGDSLVSHRVTGIGRDGYVTKGDANDGEDIAPVSAGQILGTVVFCMPFAGYGVMFLQQKAVLCLIALMLVQELFFYGLQWKGEHRNPVRKSE